MAKMHYIHVWNSQRINEVFFEVCCHDVSKEDNTSLGREQLGILHKGGNQNPEL